MDSVSARKFYLRAKVAPEDNFWGPNCLGKGPINESCRRRIRVPRKITSLLGSMIKFNRKYFLKCFYSIKFLLNQKVAFVVLFMTGCSGSLLFHIKSGKSYTNDYALQNEANNAFLCSLLSACLVSDEVLKFVHPAVKEDRFPKRIHSSHNIPFSLSCFNQLCRSTTEK